MIFRREFPASVVMTITLMVGTSIHAQIQSIYEFNGGPNDGEHPNAGLLFDGTFLYGTAEFGGANSEGVLFRVETDGSNYQVLHDFDFSTTNGNNPAGTLLLDGTTLWGTTKGGGPNGQGTIFSIETNGTGFQVRHGFSGLTPPGTINDDGAQPFAGVIMDENGILYGTTLGGGNNFGRGSIYQYDTNTDTFTQLHAFDISEGSRLEGRLLKIGDTLWGTTSDGISNIDGTLFSFDLNTNTLTTESDFQGPPTDAGIPLDGLVTDDDRIYGTSANGGANSEGAIYAFDPDTDAFELLHSFNFTEGANPSAGLLLVNNQLFGTTASGGPEDNGTVFVINTDGSGFKMLGSFPFDEDTFESSEGAFPQAELILIDNYLYGTASFGGLPDEYGTIFKIRVPEPSVLALLAVGGIITLRRHR